MRNGHYINSVTQHLQYILTRLGFMKLEDTYQGDGSFQQKTVEAVGLIRCFLGDDMTEYDEDTERNLGKFIEQLVEEGHEYF